MATGILNGSDLLLKIVKNPLGYRNVGYATEFDLQINSNEIDQTNKSSNGWKQIILGTREWTINCTALYMNESNPLFRYFSDGYGFFEDDGLVQVEFSIRNGVVGDNNLYYRGSGKIHALNLKGEVEDQAEWQLFIVGTTQLLENEY